MKRIPMPWTAIYAFNTSGTKAFIPATPWIPAEGVKRARGTFELISGQANLRVTFAYQTANVENSADAAAEQGSVMTADGMSYGTLTDVSSATNGKHLIRFGYSTYNSSAAVLVCGRAGGFVDVSAE
jgi:hypothetical protein